MIAQLQSRVKMKKKKMKKNEEEEEKKKHSLAIRNLTSTIKSQITFSNRKNMTTFGIYKEILTSIFSQKKNHYHCSILFYNLKRHLEGNGLFEEEKYPVIRKFVSFGITQQL